MKAIPRSCFCGRRALPGKSRCADHLNGSGRPASCPECGRRTEGTRYCAEHAHLEGEAGRLARQPYRKSYGSAEYHRNRELAWVRAAGRCEECDRPVTRETAECDHLVPLADGGSDALDNLEFKCTAECHPRKTREDRRRRAERRRG